MKVGDLIVEIEWPDDTPGLIVSVDEDDPDREPYKVFCVYHKSIISFSRNYIEKGCEVVSEGR